MRFEPKSEEQIATDGLLPKGEYDFEIIEAKDSTSKAGNDMIVLGVRLFDGDGRSRIVTDYLVSNILYKIRHCCEACGILHQYETGQLEPQDFIQRSGRCKVDIDKNEGYTPKNVIKDYVKAAQNGASPPPRQMAAAGIDDEIPF